MGTLNLEVDRFSVTGLLPSVAQLSSCVHLTADLVTRALRRCAEASGPTTPIQQRHRAITLHGFRLFPFLSPILGESLLLSIPQGTEMFQFPWLSQPVLCVQTGVTEHDFSRVSPFGNPRIYACLTANRGLSQPAASFIDSWCQGIHQWPLVAWIDTRIQDNICARYAVLKKPRPGQSPSRMEFPGGNSMTVKCVVCQLLHN